jgi:bifunctional DNA-binding transcriptional regulator/antitoxin component of YhaV-PrlF toxin-antitoxin module
MPSLNERSLVKLGKSGTLVVAIPRAWARYYHLKAGDRVVVIANGDVVIRPMKRPEEAEHALAVKPE